MYMLNLISHASPRSQPMHPWQLPSITFLFQYKGRFINSFFKSSALMTNIYYISLSSKLDVNEQLPAEALQGPSVHCAQRPGALGVPRDVRVEAVMQVCEPLLLHAAAPQRLRRERERCERGTRLLPDGFITAHQDLRSPRRSIILSTPPQETSLTRGPVTGELPQGVKTPRFILSTRAPSFLLRRFPPTSARH